MTSPATMPVANAPLSYGAFEATVGTSYAVPDADEVLAAMAAAGYEGTELGPPGYLGGGRELRERLERTGLRLVGGFVPLRLADPEPELAPLDTALRLFEEAGAGDARPVLADAGAPGRLEHPGRGEGGLDPGGWRSLVENVSRAVNRARARGFEPTFHHHGGSHVETPAEIERLLEDCDVGLLLDTGHLVLAGGDPVRALRDWGERVDHVHIKDVRRERLDEGGMLAAWEAGVFCPLGAGDADLDAFLAELDRCGYEGWLVVEQDRVLDEGEPLDGAVRDQERNLRWLKEHVA